MTRALTVEVAGVLTTVQDLGRPGLAGWGVSPSGAADRGSLRLANRLVGNPESAAGLEVTLGGLGVRARGDLVVAVTGADVDVTVDGRAVGAGTAVAVADGQRLRLGPARTGLRAYLAVRGGVAVPEVLGSRSTDLLSGLGPRPARAGQVLPVGAPPASLPAVDVAPVGPAGGRELALRVVPGPRDDWFQPAALEVLLSSPYRVTPDSNRVGMKLSGPVLARSIARELPSEGVVRGALQVPPSGQPVLFLADHPVTGGYPVIAVVVDEDTDLAAQARPGALLRFARSAPGP